MHSLLLSYFVNTVVVLVGSSKTGGQFKDLIFGIFLMSTCLHHVFPCIPCIAEYKNIHMHMRTSNFLLRNLDFEIDDMVVDKKSMTMTSPSMTIPPLLFFP